MHGFPSGEDHVARETLRRFDQLVGRQGILGVDFAAVVRVGREHLEAFVEEVLQRRRQSVAGLMQPYQHSKGKWLLGKTASTGAANSVEEYSRVDRV